MPEKFRWLSLLACALVPLACAEGTAPGVGSHDLDLNVPDLIHSGSQVHASKVSSSLNPPPDDDGSGGGGGGDSPPPGAPAEFNTAAQLLQTWTDAGFTTEVAFAQAYMKYVGTDAEQSVSLSLRYKQQPVASHVQTDPDSHYSPFLHDITTSTSLAITGRCGYIVDGSGDHTAWNQWTTGSQVWVWQRVHASESKSRVQPPCLEGDSTYVQVNQSGAGPRDSTSEVWVICWWADYYVNGEFQYRQQLGCYAI